MRILVETVVCSVEDAVSAEAASADRVELCSAIEVGGLTPSIGLLRAVLDSCQLPVMAMVRPRSGHFTYSESELDVMTSDTSALIEAGAHGIVFGVLTEDDQVDVAACRKVLAACGGRETVFHRAFDRLLDPRAGLETLIELGFTRVMTSGGDCSAIEGAGVLRELAALGRGRIEVMAGGGVRASELGLLVERSGLDQVHLGPRRSVGAQPGPYGEAYSLLDAAVLAEVIGAAREPGRDLPPPTPSLKDKPL